MVVGAVILLWLLGRERGLLGSLVGGFVGALVLVGMTTATTQGELASMYTPAELAVGVVALGLLATALAVVAPSATAVTAMAWMAGSVIAAATAARSGQTTYLAPLALNALVAASVARVAARRVSGAG
jgi:hypothetical protein